MKTTLVSVLAVAGLALSVSSAFAFSNSPEGRVVVDTAAPAITSHEQATHTRFLSGQVYDQSDVEGDRPILNQYFGLSSNAIQGREFHAVQQGGHWFHEGGE